MDGLWSEEFFVRVLHGSDVEEWLNARMHNGPHDKGRPSDENRASEDKCDSAPEGIENSPCGKTDQQQKKRAPPERENYGEAERGTYEPRPSGRMLHSLPHDNRTKSRRNWNQIKNSPRQE